MGLPSASLPVCARGYRERDFALVCGREGVGVCSLRGLLSRLSSAVYCIPVTAPGSALASRARHALVTRSHTYRGRYVSGLLVTAARRRRSGGRGSGRGVR